MIQPKFSEAFYKAMIAFMKEMQKQGWEPHDTQRGTLGFKAHDKMRTSKLTGYSFNWKSFWMFKYKGETVL
jgi:hypothetical protein